jgi:hypothetical protein
MIYSLSRLDVGCYDATASGVVKIAVGRSTPAMLCYLSERYQSFARAARDTRVWMESVCAVFGG